MSQTRNLRSRSMKKSVSLATPHEISSKVRQVLFPKTETVQSIKKPKKRKVRRTDYLEESDNEIKLQTPKVRSELPKTKTRKKAVKLIATPYMSSDISSDEELKKSLRKRRNIKLPPIQLDDYDSAGDRMKGLEKNLKRTKKSNSSDSYHSNESEDNKENITLSGVKKNKRLSSTITKYPQKVLQEEGLSNPKDCKIINLETEEDNVFSSEAHPEDNEMETSEVVSHNRERRHSSSNIFKNDNILEDVKVNRTLDGEYLSEMNTTGKKTLISASIALKNPRKPENGMNNDEVQQSLDDDSDVEIEFHVRPKKVYLSEFDLKSKATESSEDLDKSHHSEIEAAVKNVPTSPDTKRKYSPSHEVTRQSSSKSEKHHIPSLLEDSKKRFSNQVFEQNGTDCIKKERRRWTRFEGVEARRSFQIQIENLKIEPLSAQNTENSSPAGKPKPRASRKRWSDELRKSMSVMDLSTNFKTNSKLVTFAETNEIVESSGEIRKSRRSKSLVHPPESLSSKLENYRGTPHVRKSRKTVLADSMEDKDTKADMDFEPKSPESTANERPPRIIKSSSEDNHLQKKFSISSLAASSTEESGQMTSNLEDTPKEPVRLTRSNTFMIERNGAVVSVVQPPNRRSRSLNREQDVSLSNEVSANLETTLTGDIGDDSFNVTYEEPITSRKSSIGTRRSGSYLKNKDASLSKVSPSITEAITETPEISSNRCSRLNKIEVESSQMQTENPEKELPDDSIQSMQEASVKQPRRSRKRWSDELRKSISFMDLSRNFKNNAKLVTFAETEEVVEVLGEKCKTRRSKSLADSLEGHSSKLRNYSGTPHVKKSKKCRSDDTIEEDNNISVNAKSFESLHEDRPASEFQNSNQTSSPSEPSLKMMGKEKRSNLFGIEKGLQDSRRSTSSIRTSKRRSRSLNTEKGESLSNISSDTITMEDIWTNSPGEKSTNTSGLHEDPNGTFEYLRTSGGSSSRSSRLTSKGRESDQKSPISEPSPMISMKQKRSNSFKSGKFSNDLRPSISDIRTSTRRSRSLTKETITLDDTGTDSLALKGNNRSKLDGILIDTNEHFTSSGACSSSRSSRSTGRSRESNQMTPIPDPSHKMMKLKRSNSFRADNSSTDLRPSISHARTSTRRSRSLNQGKKDSLSNITSETVKLIDTETNSFVMRSTNASKFNGVLNEEKDHTTSPPRSTSRSSRLTLKTRTSNAMTPISEQDPKTIAKLTRSNTFKIEKDSNHLRPSMSNVQITNERSRALSKEVLSPNKTDFEGNPNDTNEYPTETATSSSRGIKPSGSIKKRRDTYELDVSVNDVSVLKTLSENSLLEPGVAFLSEVPNRSKEGFLVNVTKRRKLLKEEDTQCEIGVPSGTTSAKKVSFKKPMGLRKSISFDQTMFSSPPSCSSTPKCLNTKPNLLKRVLERDAKENIFRQRRSRSYDESYKKISKIRMPNFAKIHQKAVDKMEDIQQMAERKAERARLLMSGQKPTQDSSASRDNKTVEDKRPEKKKVYKQLDFNKLQSGNLNGGILRVVPKEDKSRMKENNLESRPKNTTENSSPKPKTNIMKNKQGPAKPVTTLYGFKVKPGVSENKAEQIKAIATKTKVHQNNREDRRHILSGVRSNRRFELLMKMRKKEDKC